MRQFCCKSIKVEQILAKLDLLDSAVINFKYMPPKSKRNLQSENTCLSLVTSRPTKKSKLQNIPSEQLDAQRASKIRAQILSLQRQQIRVINKIEIEHVKHYPQLQTSLDQLDQQYFLVHFQSSLMQQPIGFFQFIYYQRGQVIFNNKVCQPQQQDLIDKESKQPLMQRQFYADYEPGFQEKLKQIQQKLREAYIQCDNSKNRERF